MGRSERYRGGRVLVTGEEPEEENPEEEEAVERVDPKSDDEESSGEYKASVLNELAELNLVLLHCIFHAFEGKKSEKIFKNFRKGNFKYLRAKAIEIVEPPPEEFLRRKGQKGYAVLDSFEIAQLDAHEVEGSMALEDLKRWKNNGGDATDASGMEKGSEDEEAIGEPEEVRIPINCYGNPVWDEQEEDL